VCISSEGDREGDTDGESEAAVNGAFGAVRSGASRIEWEGEWE
jgi:hypothetical protein